MLRVGKCIENLSVATKKSSVEILSYEAEIGVVPSIPSAQMKGRSPTLRRILNTIFLWRAIHISDLR